MNIDELKQDCLRLIETTDIAYLTTITKDGIPHIRAVMNLRNSKKYPNLAEIFKQHQDDFQTYISTRTSSEKIKQISINNIVSIYYCNPEKYLGVMLTGESEIISDLEVKYKIWQDNWKMLYPKGKDDPEYSLIRIRPLFAKGWWQSKTFKFELAEKQ